MVKNNIFGRHIFRIVVGISLSILIITGGASAATITLDERGGADYTKIQDVINAANAGDNIENMNINKQLAYNSGAPGNYETRGYVYITSDNPAAKPTWNAQYFPGFFYDIKYNRMTETLAITRTMAQLEVSRTLTKNELVYTTGKADVDFKVFEKENKTVLGSQNYPLVGWMAEKWIAVKGKANKLAKLTYEMTKEDKKTLTTGETWTLGAGYELTINAIDAKTNPRQVWFTLKKDGAVVDEGISDEKNIFTKTMTIQGESDALLFAVFVDRIFSGATSDMVQFKYAWLIDASTSMEVKSADKFGPFEVRTATADNIMLDNENSVNLSKNSETTVLGNIKFVIADSDELRFYPDVKYTAPGKYETRGYVYITSDNPAAKPSWDAKSFAEFFYDIKYNRITETLAITRTMNELEASRTLQKDELVYTTEKANVDFKVFEKENKTVLKSATYPLVGWMGEKWVAINGKANKLAKLTFEMDKEDKKNMTIGETWALGDGYELTINAIDAKSNPRQVWFTLKKDGAVIDEDKHDEKNVYTKTMTIQGESDALLFTVYVDRIFSGATSDKVQFKYAWLIDASTSIEIKSADKFGPFEVRTATVDNIILDNDNSISLNKNSETTVLGNIRFVIADSNELRFYPKVDYMIETQNPTPTPTATATLTPTQTVTATPSPKPTAIPIIENRIATIVTEKGTIKFELYEKETPITTENFIELAQKGFYDGLTFHRVEPGFVIQGGDPNGDGTGGSGKTIPLEINSSLTHKKGAVGMARSQDPNSASSQFYICLEDAKFLDNSYAVFGQVIAGQDIVENITKGDKMLNVTVNTQPIGVIKGDVSGDGQVTVVDALFIAQYTVGTRNLTATQLAAADVNNDVQVTIVDSLFIAQYTVGLRQL